MEQNKHTIRSEEEKKVLKVRIKKIQGQLNSITNMIDNDAYCENILMQLSATREAINSLSEVILKKHLNGCIKDKVNNEETIEEILRLFKSYRK